LPPFEFCFENFRLALPIESRPDKEERILKIEIKENPDCKDS